MRPLYLAVLLTLPALAGARETDAQPLGSQTRAWIDLQTSNNAAYGAPEPVPGEVASRVYERYLKSFEQAIPETFERESFIEE